MRTYLFTVCFILACCNLQATTYYVSNTGSDSNTGTSTISTWKTLDKVNNYSFEPGDSILFKRGDIWRGQLTPKSGDDTGHIYYGTYGEGEKALFLGSVNVSEEIHWENIEDNIWSTNSVSTSGIEIIPNPSFVADANYWNFYTHSNVEATGERVVGEYVSPPASFNISCVSSGEQSWQIQLATHNISIETGKLYRLSFNAKCSEPFGFHSVMLMQSVDPYDLYFSNSLNYLEIETEWNLYNVYFTANTSADDAMITFLLGGALPDNSEFYIDDISLQEVLFQIPITTDVGNIIFNDAQEFGVKKWNYTDLQQQGDYWFNSDNLTVNIYSETNPAIHYSSIECALSHNIINQQNTSYVIYENLALKYGSAHGFGGGNTDNIIIRACDISYIGGGGLYFADYNLYSRYGNGIEFWGNASNNLVEQCRIWEIYDAAITNQNTGSSVVQSNIIYRNNLISNAEWSYEYWNRPETSVTENIYFVNNTCLYAGVTWAQNQRDFNPTIRSAHVLFFETNAATTNFNIYNNIFYESASTGLYALRGKDLSQFNFNYNNWYQTYTDTLVKIYYDEDFVPYFNIMFTNEQYEVYQNTYSQDNNSIYVNPLFLDEIIYDYRLSPSSPCIDVGYPNSFDIIFGEFDFIGNLRIQGNPLRIDIGCIESEHLTELKMTDNRDEITIFPNPFSNLTNIKFNTEFQNITLEIYNSLGQLVKEKNNISGNTTTIYRDNLPVGLYIIRLTEDKKVIYLGKVLIDD